MLLAFLLIGLVPPGGALAQQDPPPVSVGEAPHIWLPAGPDASGPDVTLVPQPSPMSQFQTRFAVVDAPAQFDQVLQIVDFPAGTWTPLHTPGGYVYTTVIEGAIITRSTRRGDVFEAAYEPGETFVETPGEYMQVGNATTANTRIMATALLPARAPLTIYQDGFTSSAYPTLANWNYTHDLNFPLPGPETVYRSVSEVKRPEGAFDLVQLVLDLAAFPPVTNDSGDEVRGSCQPAWSRLAGDTLGAYTHQFERVAANLCVSSGYEARPVAPSAAVLDDYWSW
jgi:quercetin dioxygenase-like cupin family protein